MEKVYLLIGLGIALQVTLTCAILCYQCSDSTEDPSKATCQFSVRGLAKQRDGHQNKKKALKKFPNLKNCSHYVNNYGEEQYPFCKIETISSFGEIRGYIRDCSDGRDLSEDFRNTTRVQYSLGFVKVDNQSTCGYSRLQYANICVKLCDTDFCNGPFAGAERLKGYSLTVILLLVFFTIYNNSHY